MADYREACDNRIYILTSKLIYLFITNVWFLVTISPIILYFFTAGENISIAVLTFLGILLGPALATMFSVTHRAMMDKQNNATKDYFHFYKLNLMQGLFVAGIINLILMVCYLDVEYFYSINNKAIGVIFILLALFMGAISLYIFPILARVNAKAYDLFKLSIKLVFKKFYITLTNISLLIIGCFAVKFTNIALIAVLFGGSAVCYLILTMEKNIIKEAEEYFKEKYNN